LNLSGPPPLAPLPPQSHGLKSFNTRRSLFFPPPPTIDFYGQPVPFWRFLTVEYVYSVNAFSSSAVIIPFSTPPPPCIERPSVSPHLTHLQVRSPCFFVKVAVCNGNSYTPGLPPPLLTPPASRFSSFLVSTGIFCVTCGFGFIVPPRLVYTLFIKKASPPWFL